MVLSRHDKMETELAYNNNVLLRIKFKHIYTSIAKYHILFPKSSIYKQKYNKSISIPFVKQSVSPKGSLDYLYINYLE